MIPDELRFVEIIAVTAKSGSDANTEEQAGDGKELPSTVTVLVRPEQSRLLGRLEAEGEIHLSLVYRGESTKAAQFIEVQDQVLDEMLEENGGEENGTEGADGEMPYNADSGNSENENAARTSDSGDTEKEPEEMNPEASETTESSADREEL